MSRDEAVVEPLVPGLLRSYKSSRLDDSVVAIVQAVEISRDVE